MSKLLEKLQPGTPVFVGENVVGEVRGVYGVGESKLAEFLHVFWTSEQAEVLVPTAEVQDIETRGVLLQGTLETYRDLAQFDAPSRPGITRLA